ncbi:hypothetical protein FAI41_04080 [Acetobacteraceae bacterium]|nr:hypothetical protein FAI41_04080 [Acetobacteraceae bacterium]
MKKTFLLASALFALPLSTSFAMAQNNGSRSYLNVGNPSGDNVGAFAGSVKDSKGVQLGTINLNGDIVDGGGDIIGKINAEGQVTDPNGKNLGVVAPADRFGAYNLAKKSSINN